MTNPNNAIGTNAAYGGRTSVNAFNDDLTVYTAGVLSGWEPAEATGMTMSFGGQSGVRDVAVVEDNAGNKTTINNISGQPINVTFPVAPVKTRLDALVVYVDNSPQGNPIDVDNPGACGIIVVKGEDGEPSDEDIRAAITADGASGATAYYTEICWVSVPAGATDIWNEGDIDWFQYSTITTPLNYPENQIEPYSIGGDKIKNNAIDTANIRDNAVTTTKINDHAVTAVKTNFGGNFSESEQNTGFTWIDGRYIYKKTINFGALPNATSKTMALGISNIAMIISLSGVAVQSGSFCRPLPYTSSDTQANNIALYTTDSNNLTITTGSDRSYLTGYITLYYTKTS